MRNMQHSWHVDTNKPNRTNQSPRRSHIRIAHSEPSSGFFFRCRDCHGVMKSSEYWRGSSKLEWLIQILQRPPATVVLSPDAFVEPSLLWIKLNIHSRSPFPDRRRANSSSEKSYFVYSEINTLSSWRWELAVGIFGRTNQQVINMQMSLNFYVGLMSW